ncbi:MAG: hypothetical protein DMD94_17380 [Candidatus Rokuibacteriota bacterium]|nr:MAG: hypothetical protein DMD94_17380 [Candidatus Rokubacteria bacterium]
MTRYFRCSPTTAFSGRRLALLGVAAEAERCTKWLHDRGVRGSPRAALTWSYSSSRDFARGPGSRTPWPKRCETSSEEGCLGIHAFRSIRDPQLFYIRSRWKDEAAFEIHSGLPHTIRFVERVEPLIDHPFDVTRAEQIG